VRPATWMPPPPPAGGIGFLRFLCLLRRIASVFTVSKVTALASAHSWAAAAARSKVWLMPSSVSPSVVQATSSTKKRALTPGTSSAGCYGAMAFLSKCFLHHGSNCLDNGHISHRSVCRSTLMLEGQAVCSLTAIYTTLELPLLNMAYVKHSK